MAIYNKDCFAALAMTIQLKFYYQSAGFFVLRERVRRFCFHLNQVAGLRAARRLWQAGVVFIRQSDEHKAVLTAAVVAAHIVWQAQLVRCDADICRGGIFVMLDFCVMLGLDPGINCHKAQRSPFLRQLSRYRKLLQVGRGVFCGEGEVTPLIFTTCVSLKAAHRAVAGMRARGCDSTSILDITGS